jgi:hypothetical protein
MSDCLLSAWVARSKQTWSNPEDSKINRDWEEGLILGANKGYNVWPVV